MGFDWFCAKGYGEPFVSKWRYKIPCVGVPNWKDKSTPCVLSTRVHLVGIDSMCFINSILWTSSGKDRLDVFYQLDLATASGKDRLDSRSLGEKASFEGGLIWL